jgi:hypothetical protein
MNRELQPQHLAQAAEQNIAIGAEHIEWQQEVLTILERISISAEAIDGARALLTTFLETQAQREKDRDRIRASLDCNLDSSSTVPLAQPVDQPNEAAGVDNVAGAHLCADRTHVQPEAKPGPVQFEAKPGYFWRVGRAAVAWIACLLGRHRNRWNTGGPRR